MGPNIQTFPIMIYIGLTAISTTLLTPPALALVLFSLCRPQYVVWCPVHNQNTFGTHLIGSDYIVCRCTMNTPLTTAFDREHSVGLAIAKPAKQDKSG